MHWTQLAPCRWVDVVLAPKRTRRPNRSIAVRERRMYRSPGAWPRARLRRRLGVGLILSHWHISVCTQMPVRFVLAYYLARILVRLSGRDRVGLMQESLRESLLRRYTWVVFDQEVVVALPGRWRRRKAVPALGMRDHGARCRYRGGGTRRSFVQWNHFAPRYRVQLVRAPRSTARPRTRSRGRL